MTDRALRRFVSFAFSAADILVETDQTGRIGFAAGATGAFGQSADSLVGAALTDLFGPTSRRLVTTMIDIGREDHRVGPCRVSIDGRSAQLSAWRLRESESTQWTVLFDAMDRPASLDGDFAACARRIIMEETEQGRPVDLGLFWLDGANQVADQLGAQAAETFFSHLHDVVRLHARNGAATRVGDSTFGLVCADPTALMRLEDLVDEIALAEGLHGIGARSQALTADGATGVERQIQSFLDAAAHLDATGETPVSALLAELADRMKPAAEARMNALKLTIQGRLIEPYAQPIFEAESGELSGLELLARLPGGRSFDQGVQAAERGGVVGELDLEMTRTAVEFLQQGASRPSLFVNLSGASVSDAHFMRDLLDTLEDIRIDRTRLGFEITETRRICDVRVAAELIDALRKRRHPVALDDFGSGAAGLEYLRRFEVDRVKLDGALVPKTAPTDRDRAVVGAICAMVHQLGATVTAEQVEEKWQAAMLAGCGVDHLQGWLYGPAEPLGEVMARYRPDLSRDEAEAAFG